MLKIPAKEKEPENEVRDKRLKKKKRTENFHSTQRKRYFQGGSGNISYAVKCYQKSIY